MGVKTKFTIQRISEPESRLRYLIVLDDDDLSFGWAAPGKSFAVFDSRSDAAYVRDRLGRHSGDATVVRHAAH